VSKPIAELVRNGSGMPVLGLYNLSPEHFEALHPVLQLNGESLMHNLRAQAGAHLDAWSPESRMVEVALHGSDPWLFIHGLCMSIGMSPGRVPNLITGHLGE
jgi:hypothetical protein